MYVLWGIRCRDSFYKLIGHAIPRHIDVMHWTQLCIFLEKASNVAHCYKKRSDRANNSCA